MQTSLNSAIDPPNEVEREYDGDGAGRNLIRNYPGPGHGGRVVWWCGVVVWCVVNWFLSPH